MSNVNLCSTVFASSLLVIAWTSVAGAQQQAGTNVATAEPAPSGETGGATPTTTTLEEPVIDASTQKSAFPNFPLMTTGFVLLGATYGASVIGAAVSDRASDDKLNYPLVGPWMALKDRDCSAHPCGRKLLGTTLLVGSGVLQGVGALGMVMGLFIPRTTTHQWYLIGNEEGFVMPLLGAGELGAAAVGRF